MHTDFQELERLLAEFERDLEAALHHCHHAGDRPVTGTITATTKDGTVTDTYTPGTPIYLTAGDFANAEGTAITGTVPGSWSSDQGTITANPNNADEATLVNVPLGPVNVTFTASSGLVLQYAATVADQTPVSGTITGSTTAPIDEPAAA